MSVLEPDGFHYKHMSDNNNSKKPNAPPFMDEVPPYTDEDYYVPDMSWEPNEKFDDAIPKNTNMGRNNKEHFPEAVREKKDKKDLHANPLTILKEVFHFDSFRPYQQKVCESVIMGNNVLLVMPHRGRQVIMLSASWHCKGGATLVVSPLIALMEDQVFRS